MAQNVSILLAEDNDVVRRSISDFLMRAGYFVTEARTGSEALALFRKIKPHLVITDLRMPDLDGLQFIRVVREESEQTPCIIVSGEGTMEDVIYGLRLGAWDYLVKPIHPIELLQHSVERTLKMVGLMRQNRMHQEYLEETIKQRTAELLLQNQAYEKEISERKVAEDQALEARNEWERTMDALPDMIAIVDLHNHIIRLNKAMQEKIGRPTAEIIGRTCFMCTEEIPCPHMKMLADKKPLSTEVYSGKLDCHFLLDIIPFYSTRGDLVGSVHIFRDISGQKTAMREKEILQAQLLQAHKLESVGQLASGIAHEINTPAQFVSSNVGFLDEAFDDLKTIISTLANAADEHRISPDILHDTLNKTDWPYLEREIPIAINQSREGLARVTSIVRAMKEFSHPGGKDFNRVDINHIIEVTVTVARNEWKYGAEMVLDLAPDLPPVDCLEDSLGQVILNLLVNAAHTITEKLGQTPGGDKGLITISTESSDTAILIHITDTGCGIPEEVRGKIFDPFFTTKDVGRGTGQGLAIAYDVVTRKHGGSLSFVTKVGEGTTFTIRLPVNRHKTP